MLNRKRLKNLLKLVIASALCMASGVGLVSNIFYIIIYTYHTGYNWLRVFLDIPGNYLAAGLFLATVIVSWRSLEDAYQSRD